MIHMTHVFTAYATVIGVGGYLALRLGGVSLLFSVAAGCVAAVAVAALLAV